ncbi:HEAT repeat domain-containing protein [Corallincola spongiicola]|uniref:HEAT repeat domain-containing protein n=1 Tax=Corallincola spongiicola TaxID=2520508 RepID=A0ABY1WPV0_9GAMM|nr:HEAT repeat domain-containing protein [Corallincola spongiicola]TAA46752.1 HEAT repeat domain-containing protein [Corallincola spongiicola]
MIKTAEEFVRLRNSDIPEEYSRASHGQATVDVWKEVIATYPEMAFWVAHNKTVPYELLELLSENGESRVRSMVASKNMLLEPLLLKLATDEDDSVRMAVARHKKATLAVLEKFANDPWEEIVALVSKRIKNGSFK